MQNVLDLSTFKGPLYFSMTRSIIFSSLLLGLVMKSKLPATCQAGTERR